MATCHDALGHILHSPSCLFLGMIFLGSSSTEKSGRRPKNRGPVNLRRLSKSRHRYWVHALVACLALAGEIHLFSVEVFHHHEATAKVCKTRSEGATHLHASQEISPFCPLCQVARSSAVRPAVRAILSNPHSGTPFCLTVWETSYSLNLTHSLGARSPPLS